MTCTRSHSHKLSLNLNLELPALQLRLLDTVLHCLMLSSVLVSLARYEYLEYNDMFPHFSSPTNLHIASSLFKPI